MKAVVYHQHGSPADLVVEDIAPPELREGDALIDVGATSMNGFDPMMLAGSTGLKTPMPMIPCGDYAGRIAGFGPDTDPGAWKIGDRVCPHPFVFGEGMTGETRTGAACEQVRIPVANLIAVPDAVSDVQAASLPIAYGTAYRMMRTRGRVEAGETVLVLGASGGVGTGCVQLAKSVGATVIATGSSPEKLDRLRELGADHVIDSRAEDWVAQVHAISGKPRMGVGGGVDVAINYIGGETWAQSLRCLRADGRMLTCGATIGFNPPTDIRYIWTYEQRIIGSNGWMPDEQIALLDLVAKGGFEPVIDRVLPMEGLHEGMQALIDREVFGKVMVEIRSDS
ncbi:MAG: zinc-binding dehydrogenase [Myxococcota bacterium]|jgi:alcohol dehydrogenase|nr:zinc-binding dehydrogenase [Myxococcota bacterium]